ncbi:hypothetical protein [Antrihabitans sp. YC2-6]|uniref:hypothetical protein n=1 Tax=Antrihabitans sp. YC2-6 TaxID=2799498 RepID=UPI0018F4C7DA|nr:hypothetical protein [Antrihabitans sp. YC2-6]MBJ8348388.1 hypothetical protein [Antrihabitans sp. YC2-6]
MTTPGERPARQRVVLSQRRGARAVRTRVEVQEHTAIGDALVRGLVRAQLGLAVRLALVTVVALCAIPLLGIAFPSFGTTALLGIRLPWLLLGIAAYPLLFGVGKLYVRLAERNEQDFSDLVDD